MVFKRVVNFYVDGKSEKAIKEKINLTSLDVRFIQRTLNGGQVSVKTIGKECSTLLKAGSKFSNVNIFIVDREKRLDITAAQMEIEISNEVRREIVNGSFDVVVADMMFENWILSDIAGVSSKHTDCLSGASNSSEYEGKNGSFQLDSLWITNRHDRYSSDKVGNAKKLFKAVNSSIGVHYSSSFRKFIDILTKHRIKFY